MLEIVECAECMTEYETEIDEKYFTCEPCPKCSNNTELERKGETVKNNKSSNRK
ncbi:hypothetical protein F982_03798 [Acinetobacter baumannii NIPH 1362]|nr:hypothetical protein F982_03798 [Acinetobacter baumannii NIPH 1362]WCL23221.1 hypothetical protein OMP06_19172 [Acinetobacter baumannii]